MRVAVSLGLTIVPLALAVLAVWRMVSRGSVDAGYVSQGWLAEKRSDAFDPSR
jgi:hypothetical protein